MGEQKNNESAVALSGDAAKNCTKLSYSEPLAKSTIERET